MDQGDGMAKILPRIGKSWLRKLGDEPLVGD